MVLPNHNSYGITPQLKMLQWRLSSLKVKSPNPCRSRFSRISSCPSSHISTCTPNHCPVRCLPIISSLKLTTLPRPTARCCDYFSPEGHILPWAVLCEQSYKNLMDNRSLLPETNIWKRKQHFILNETIMLNWNFPWRHQALMI